MPRPTWDDLRSNFTPTGICQTCGKTSALLCDGRIYKFPSGKEIRVPMNFINGPTRSCDAMTCRACAKKVSDVHIKMKGGCQWNTIDLCAKCAAVEGKELTDAARVVQS